MAQGAPAAKRDLEAREPRRGRSGGSRPAKGGGSGSRLEKAANVASLIGSASEVANNAHQIAQGAAAPVAKRDPGHRISYSRKLAAAKSIGASFGQMLGNAQTISQNHLAGQQQQQQPEQDQTAPPPSATLRPASPAAVVPVVPVLIGSASELAVPAKRDIEAREPRRGRSGRAGRTGGSGNRLEKAANVARP
ncbi:hypothetical protein GGTG_14438 [Gaeumannomyces tritici R3-111a-1]|uniref:Uncharacterized protein n=1 Tax=Gaeumannomyces tritici (strain R3-111a-1) TaxID=644352 RepID=J3PLG5_GAET3|nr:hypothetical protein GGTG_14438 [Gaeumannomyces tritici R3-111a-1]EJT67985.1 hypothetical protein GGTG_14438 [Gaeumannomyces tritici R3-111a-1]